MSLALSSTATDGRGRALAALARALREGAGVVTLAAPRARVTALWDARGDAVLWQPPGEPAVAGLGVARALPVQGGALGPLEAGFALGPEHASVEAPPSQAFGGMAFAPGAADAAPWEGFGDGLFVVPRWSYGHGVEGAWLRFTADPEGADAERAQAELAAIWDRLEADAALPSAPALAAVEDAPRALWREHVEAITDAIAAGEVRKVVVARGAAVRLAGEADPRRVLHALGARFPGCARFALRRGGTTFLGATPERLVRKEGDRCRTEALAGSAPVGRGEALRASEKDRHEHALVVDAIASALAPYAELALPEGPAVRELPNVVHLHTPIEGRLREDVHVLRLVQALHPTPAVGGVPREAALRWIRDREQRLIGARGWYAAPFGAFDARGDGAFVVALRSGLLRGERAWAFAGGGIVGGSEPDAEYEEASMKMGAFLGALDPRADEAGAERGGEERAP